MKRATFPSTYTNGFDIISARPITKSDFIAMCELLVEQYGDGFEFRPEGISEGGIVFHNYPNKGDTYKTMRIQFWNGVSWPWIHSNVMEEWKNSDDVVLDQGIKLGTFLKSFRGAAPWTLRELHIFAQCFALIGFGVSDDWPSEEDLTTVM